MKNFRVVLVEPEIPSNTGNIGRTCVIANSELHLVGPLGFEITDKRLKRAGLDYWPHLKWAYYENWNTWLKEASSSSPIWFFSTKAENSFYEASFQLGDTFIFGRETKGLDEALLTEFKDRALKIPMIGPVRSLNLANAVAVSLYEGLRQTKSFLP